MIEARCPSHPLHAGGMSGQLRLRPDREPSFVMLITLRVALIQPVIRPQAGRSEATEPKPRFVLLMRNNFELMTSLPYSNPSPAARAREPAALVRLLTLSL